MSERKINISDTLQYNLAILGININAKHENYMLLLDAIKKVIGEALELAAENANLKYCESKWDVPEGVANTGDPEYGYHYIDKQSILGTINQIE